MHTNNHKIRILLAVWGEKYIDDFLSLSLPSLLAEGNIPALTKTYPTHFVFLARSQDIPFFKNHSQFSKLTNLCEVEFIEINDLIVFGNYSTTLTLAFDRAIKETGVEMLQTYFIFLTSDYIMANGSMEGLLRYIERGYSGICSGNFQVIGEEIKPFLLKHIDPDTNVMQISPRELLKKSFQCLHPIVTSSLYHLNALHNYYANRFFYRYSSNIMAGRFYLLHMLCIKPERMDYKIGSSCDYSFIPEMCPSGNVAIIKDSDDYLVIEIQAKRHEILNVNWGKFNIQNTAQALSAWTTKQHRENAQSTIYFHTKDLTKSEIEKIETNLNGFIEAIDKDLANQPCQPHYNHPYWKGAIASFTSQSNFIKNSSNSFEYFNFNHPTYLPFFKYWYYKLFGTPPKVYPWHHRFCEYRAVRNILQLSIDTKEPEHTVIIYDGYHTDFLRYFSWIQEKLGIKNQFDIVNLKEAPDKIKELTNSFNNCIFMLRLDNLYKLQKDLSLIKQIIKPESTLHILIANEHNQHSALSYDFKSKLAYRFHHLINNNFNIINIQTLNNSLTWLGAATIDKITKKFSYNQKLKFAAYILIGLPGLLFVILANLLKKQSPNEHCTHILVTLEPEKDVIHDKI